MPTPDGGERAPTPGCRLDSFILAVTPFERVRPFWGMSKTEMAERHVLFIPPKDRATDVGEDLRRMGVDS